MVNAFVEVFYCAQKVNYKKNIIGLELLIENGRLPQTSSVSSAFLSTYCI